MENNNNTLLFCFQIWYQSDIFNRLIRLHQWSKPVAQQKALDNRKMAEKPGEIILNHKTKEGIKMEKTLAFLKEKLDKTSYKMLKSHMENEIWLTQFRLETKIEEDLRPPITSIDTSSIINLTSIQLPIDIQWAISFGPKFVYPTETIDMSNFIPDLETMIDFKINDLLKEETIKRCALTLNKIKKQKINPNELSIWLNFIGQRTQSFFRHNSNILLLPSDKGKNSVIIYKTEYMERIQNMLDDETTYCPCTDEREKNIVTCGKFNDSLYELKIIDSVQRNKLSEKTATTSKFYGLPKIHKKNYPLRPITSAINSPGTKLAKYLVQLLAPIFLNNELHMKNSYECKKLLDQVIVEGEEILVSFDVVSMFTNIPVELAISIIKKKADHIYETTRIPFDLLEEILTFVLKDCATFRCTKRCYKQRRGLAMGSPLSPLLSNIVIGELMTSQIPRLTMPPKFLVVYVDDTLAVIPHSQVNEMLALLNDYHTDIQFTVEKEIDGKINFLDITVERGENNIITNWFKKSYASNRILNYLSGHQRKTIIGTSIAFIKTVLRLSDESFFTQNREHITHRLRCNNFPEIEILRLMNEHYTLMRPISREKADKIVMYGAIPMVNGTTSAIKRTIATLIPDLCMVARPIRNNYRIFSTVKDPTELEDRTNMIAKIICNCGRKTIVSGTKYQERFGTAIDSITQEFDFSNNPCGNTHYFESSSISGIMGGRNFPTTQLKKRILAYEEGNNIINRNELPHCKWRKLL